MTYGGSRGRTDRAWPWACRLGLLCLVAGFVGCGDDDDGNEPERPEIREPIESGGDPGTGGNGSMVSCAGESDGAECGVNQHCVKSGCAYNRCGDGLRAGIEDCDDGNQRTGDGCDPACRVEGEGCGNGELEEGEECDDANWIDIDACSNQCTFNVCGNQRLELMEECDDGNTVDDDACSNACQVVQCRNGRIEPGEDCDDGNSENRDACTNACRSVDCGNGRVEEWEECDDGNEVDQDDCTNDCNLGAVCGDDVVEGSEVCEGPHQGLPGPRNRDGMCTLGAPTTEVEGEEESWSCSADCKQRAAYDDCDTCRDKWCRDVLGVDMVAGCSEVINTEFGAGGGDLCFLQQCTDVVNCAIANRCALDPDRELAECYCGKSRDNVTCQQMGPAPDAPCVAELWNATRTTVNSEVLGLFGELTLPMGFADYLMRCYVGHCNSECLQEPSCTSDADCAGLGEAGSGGSGPRVCCATGKEDSTEYHNFRCVKEAQCAPGLSVNVRRACTANTDCPPAYPHCSGSFVLPAGKKVCDDRAPVASP